MKRAGASDKPKILIKSLPRWAQAEWRKLRRIMRGDAKSRAESRMLRRLSAVVVSATPHADRQLVGNIVGRLGSALIYAESLEKSMQEIACTNGRGRRESVRLTLSVINEQLSALSRQTRGLNRDIPRLLKQLGTHRKREPRT